MFLEAHTWANIAFDYAGYNALVAGGSNGIGLAIAQADKAASAKVTIAGPVLFLISPAAAYIAGQTLPVDGGYTISGEP